MAELVKAKVENAKKVRIHNDLMGAADHFKAAIEEKQKNGGSGITYDCMACATMLAFTWEAYLNFFGAELLALWNERQELDEKINRVLQKLKITPDWSRRPYSSITTLTKLRNLFAHGKPIVTETEDIVVGKAEKIQNKEVDLSGDWQQLCTPDLISKAHEDLNEIFKVMLEASGLSYYDTLTQAEGSISFIEHVSMPAEKTP
jgi:hypothetical protein